MSLKFNGFETFSKDIQLTQYIIKKSNRHGKQSSTFGSIKIPSMCGEKFSWKFHIEACHGQMAFGICDKAENRTSNCFYYETDSINYAYRNDGKKYSKGVPEKYGAKFKKGSDIEMTLDLMKKELSFIVDSKPQKKAYNIEVKSNLEYVLAVYMSSINDCVSLKVNKIKDPNNDDEKMKQETEQLSHKMQDMEQELKNASDERTNLLQNIESLKERLQDKKTEAANIQTEKQIVDTELKISEDEKKKWKVDANDYEQKYEIAIEQLKSLKHEEDAENPFDKITSYFTSQFKSIVVVFSWYTYIMFIISMCFADDLECSTGHIIVTSITFGLFLLIPMVYTCIEVAETPTCKQIVTMFVEIIGKTFVLAILMLTVDLRPFGCLLDQTLVLQMSVFAVGLFCFLIHTYHTKHKQKIEKLKEEQDNDDNMAVNVNQIDIENEQEGVKTNGEYVGVNTTNID